MGTRGISVGILAELADRELGLRPGARLRKVQRRHRRQHKQEGDQPQPRWHLSVLSLHHLASTCASLRASCVLGFSRDGDHLLGYSRGSSDADAAGYLLKVWRARRSGATEIFAAPVFADASIGDPDELNEGGGGGGAEMVVTVAESADQRWLVAVGMEPLGSEGALRHVTVLRSPLAADAKPAQPPSAVPQGQGGDGGALPYSFSEVVSAPVGTLHLESWWLTPETLVLSRGDAIDVLNLKPERPRPTRIGGAGSAPPHELCGSARAVPLKRIRGCWARADASSPPSTAAAEGAESTAAVPVSVERWAFLVEPLLAALFSRRSVRMLDYNLQLLQPLDERTVCAVLVASVQHTEPAQVAAAMGLPHEAAFLLVIDVADGSCGTLAFKVAAPTAASRPRPMVDVAEHALMQRLRAQLGAAAASGRSGAARAVKALWREGLWDGAGRPLVYDNTNVAAGDAQTLREIAHPLLPIVLKWHAR